MFRLCGVQTKVEPSKGGFGKNRLVKKMLNSSWTVNFLYMNDSYRKPMEKQLCIIQYEVTLVGTV